MAYRTSLLKAIGCKKGQNRFCPAATGRTGQNWAAHLGRLPKECARARPAGRLWQQQQSPSFLIAHMHSLQQSRIEMRKLE